MSGVQVSAAGRMDQEGIAPVQVHPEPMQNPNAAQSPDQAVYEAYPDRCRQLKLDGSRCAGRAIPAKQNLCMVHSHKEPVDEEE